jgi:hypothetical protein
MEEAGEHCAICVWKPIRMAQKTCISKTAGRLTQQDFKTFLINKMDSNAGAADNVLTLILKQEVFDDTPDLCCPRYNYAPP